MNTNIILGIYLFGAISFFLVLWENKGIIDYGIWNKATRHYRKEAGGARWVQMPVAVEIFIIGFLSLCWPLLITAKVFAIILAK